MPPEDRVGGAATSASRQFDRFTAAALEREFPRDEQRVVVRREGRARFRKQRTTRSREVVGARHDQSVWALGHHVGDPWFCLEERGRFATAVAGPHGEGSFGEVPQLDHELVVALPVGHRQPDFVETPAFLAPVEGRPARLPVPEHLDLTAETQAHVTLCRLLRTQRRQDVPDTGRWIDGASRKEQTLVLPACEDLLRDRAVAAFVHDAIAQVPLGPEHCFDLARAIVTEWPQEQVLGQVAREARLRRIQRRIEQGAHVVDVRFEGAWQVDFGKAPQERVQTFRFAQFVFFGQDLQHAQCRVSTGMRRLALDELDQLACGTVGIELGRTLGSEDDSCEALQFGARVCLCGCARAEHEESENSAMIVFRFMVFWSAQALGLGQRVRSFRVSASAQW